MPSDQERHEREARIFQICAMCLAFAAITFGLLNAMNIIHV